jgi:hypothetical protein
VGDPTCRFGGPGHPEIRTQNVTYANCQLVKGAFARGDGRPIHPDLFSTRFARLAAKVGLAGVRLHDLRHFYASDLLRANVHPKIVSEGLGHASTAFTMDTYSHLLRTMQETAADAIEASLTATRGPWRQTVGTEAPRPGGGGPLLR